MVNKNEILKKIIKKEDKFLIGNIIDKYNRYVKTKINTYTNFFDICQLIKIEKILKSLKIDYNIYSSCEECEKKIIYFGDYEDYISIYRFKNNNFKHSEILGTFFSLGYNKYTIGDIFVNEKYVYFTNLSRLDAFIENSLYYIGNRKVDLEKVSSISFDKDRFTFLKIVISSYRIDQFVSKLAHLSRSESLKYIKNGMVFLNYEEINNPSKIVNIRDVISIRKVGKFIVSDEILVSKKSNYLVEVKKYN